MDIKSFIQRRRRPVFAKAARELEGVLSVQSHPVVTTSSVDVYRGVWGNPRGEQVEVAVKQFKALTPRNMHSDLQALRKRIDTRIKREMIIWTQTIHPNLHPFLGYRLGRQPRLISPWCRHGNLTDYVRANPGLSRLDKLLLIYQAALGLNHLHSLTPPICHADIKPENVLINNSGEAALSDFGLSRILQDLGEPSGLTTSETPRGTLRYMAPELLEEERPRPNRKTDIYAFGGLVLAVLSGKPPFGGLREVTILRRISQGQTPKSDKHPDLSPDDDFWNLMRRCWDPNPTARPAIREVLCELWEHISLETCGQFSATCPPPVTEAQGREHSYANLDISTAAGQAGIATRDMFDPVRSPKGGSLFGIANTDQTSNTVLGVFHTARRTEASLEVQVQVIPVIGKHNSAIAGTAHVRPVRFFFLNPAGTACSPLYHFFSVNHLTKWGVSQVG